MTSFPSGARIVLLISDPAERRVLTALLTAAGHCVELVDEAALMQCCCDGSLLIVDAASAQRYDETLRQLRLKLHPLYLPLLIVLTETEPAAPWLRAGFDDVLRLPLNADVVLARLEIFLRLRRHSEEMRDESTRRFRTTFDLVPVGIAHMSLDGTLRVANTQFCSMLGYAESELWKKPIADLIHPDERFDIRSKLGSLLSADAAALHQLEKRFFRRDGSVIWTSLAVSLLRDADGLPRHLIAVVEDISARKQTEHMLRESEHFIKSTIDALHMHVCVLDEAGKILAVNKAWEAFAVANGASQDMHWPQADYLAVCELAVNLADEDADAFAAGMREVACGEREAFSLEYSSHLPEQQRWFTATVTRFPGDGATRLVITHENVTQTKRAQEDLLHLAHYDTLTGLPNRTLLQDRLRQAIAQANRNGHIVWVLFLDLDRFKAVNDTLGHRAGDALLHMVAQRLKSALRETDTIARFGGDEFIMILSDSAESNLNMSVLKRVIDAVEEPVGLDGQEFALTCSIGIALYPNDGTEPETLVDHADIAMYRAKETGRNNVQFYTPAMNAAVVERLGMERHLRNALERNEFVLHYQPQVDLVSGRVVGMEALVRWQHPDLGMVAPASFIELAEETGLIVPIGAWVMRTACAQNKKWQDAGLGPLRIAVNLSARQFSQQDLAQSIVAILAETGLAANFLDIELTESIVMTEVEQTISVLQELKALGVQLSIDDFGTGYSSLSYLKRFPIDVLKIDQSFVRDITQHSGNAAISNAIISMAHSLGIKVIAEGVETEAQCAFLSRNMCDEIQGYWFSRPLPAARIEALLLGAPRLPAHLLRLQKPARTLLLVDDEDSIISSLKRLLRADGYRILCASSGREGLRLLERNKVDVIVSDQRMAGMTGVEFLRSAKQLYPDTVRIILSGYTELKSVTDAINEGSIYRFLFKPWDDDQLRAYLKEAFVQKELADENRRLNLKVRTANLELATANRQLEDALKQKQAQIDLHENSLAILHEAIHNSPLPVIGVDDENVVTFANTAAHSLLKRNDPVLGANMRELLPELSLTANNAQEGSRCMIQIESEAFLASWRSTGDYSHARGKLITLVKCDHTSAV